MKDLRSHRVTRWPIRVVGPAVCMGIGTALAQPQAGQGPAQPQPAPAAVAGQAVPVVTPATAQATGGNASPQPPAPAAVAGQAVPIVPPATTPPATDTAATTTPSVTPESLAAVRSLALGGVVLGVISVLWLLGTVSGAPRSKAPQKRAAPETSELTSGLKALTEKVGRLEDTKKDLEALRRTVEKLDVRVRAVEGGSSRAATASPTASIGGGEPGRPQPAPAATTDPLTPRESPAPRADLTGEGLASHVLNSRFVSAALTKAQETLGLLRHVPDVVLEELRRSAPPHEIADRCYDLDRALCEPIALEELAAEAAFRGQDLRPLADWLGQERAAWQARLAEKGLVRFSASAGQPFLPGRLEDSGETATTHNPSWDDRVAAVRPGDGGYELRGRVIRPARAARFVYREDGPRA